MRLVISKSHRNIELINLVEKICPSELIGMGSVGYKVTALIEDQADLYISYSPKGKSSPKDWDIAAPESIIKGAGGFLTNEKGENLHFLNDSNFNQNGLIIASMSKNHQDICLKVAQMLEADN